MFYSFLCATLWASTGIFVKFIDGMGVAQIIWGRFLIALVCGLALMKSSLWIRQFLFHRHPPIEHLLSGMMTIYYILATFAFIYCPVAMAALLIALAPLFTFLFRLIVEKTFSVYEISGFLIAFGGLCLYFSGKDYISSGYTLNNIYIGAAFATSAALLRAIFSYILHHKVLNGHSVDSDFINTNTLTLGVVCVGIYLFCSDSSFELSLSDFYYLLGLGIVATFIPNTLNTISSMKLNPTLHNIIGMSTPISASLMGWLFFGEQQDIFSVSAMIITVIGIFLSMKTGEDKIKVVKEK